MAKCFGRSRPSPKNERAWSSDPPASSTPTENGCVADDRILLRSVELDRVFNVRGTGDDPSFRSAVDQALRVSLPSDPHAIAQGNGRMLWSIGPTSWLFFAEQVHFDDIRHRLNDVDGVAFDISASNVAWSVSGSGAARA